jgi:hypothetical protein
MLRLDNYHHATGLQRVHQGLGYLPGQSFLQLQPF